MKSKVGKSIIVFGLLITILGGFNTKEVSACYPAYKCMTPPATYTLTYSNPDRRLGTILGGVAIGTVGFFGSYAAVASFGGATAYAVKEAYWGSLSYKVYIKKSDRSGYKYKTKTVYYSGTNYKNYKKTVYRYTN
ncbi:uncharacterized membrane protein YuzA (DUF378 family) [Bacillus pakistanensis]|uniref:Uncharacterized membrane protein YuzA (DUF378 family) n=1 Tax=Rossellomorea pakistanensis TaxID=992288 RepID=A0ABS2NBN3_9BACI|nr:hypothetical protein [Bacillus pakistanensis]MBM7584996.1 uncharacterized membrane protein YuzA (DUF378 family) [Bacillus pakistanensis]